jgi:hypothetical protein
MMCATGGPGMNRDLDTMLAPAQSRDDSTD